MERKELDRRLRLPSFRDEDTGTENSITRLLFKQNLSLQNSRGPTKGTCRPDEWKSCLPIKKCLGQEESGRDIGGCHLLLAQIIPTLAPPSATEKNL